MDFGQNSRRFECGLISYFVAGAIRFAQQDAEHGGNSEDFGHVIRPCFQLNRGRKLTQH